MQKIQVLASHLIDQIAAGEVIERPSSVVKELIENAIDAKANKILVLVQNAGRDLIQIVDNGEGMSSQDCLLAVQRHATSKLRVIEDLYNLTTMGFRGEALAAISSISDLEITSNRDDTSAGFFIKISNGKKINSAKIGFAKGTKVVVRNIFQTIPARLKFLKSNLTELQKIKDRVFSFALAYPNIEFRLLEEGKTLFHFSARNSLVDRLRDLLGEHITKNLFFLEYQESYIRFQGFFSLPEFCRVNKKLQFEYINNRYIQSTQLNKAVYKGYEGMLMKQLHPIYVLYTQIALSEVDVNVHPAKTQVHLKNHILVQTIISQQIAANIRQKTRIHHGLSKENFIPQTKKTDSPPQISNLADKNRLFSSPYYEKKNYNSSHKNPQTSFLEVDKSNFSSGEESFFVANANKTHPPKNGSLHSTDTVLSKGKGVDYINILGIYKKYLFAQVNERFAMVDVHAAHERIRFEELKKKILQNNKKSPLFLIQPFIIKFSPYDNEKILENFELFKKNGLILKKEKDSFLVEALPSGLQEIKNEEQTVKNFILELVEEKENFQNTRVIGEAIHSRLQNQSCHSAIRGAEQVVQMSLSEMQELITQICQNDMIIYCPHGRPIIIFYEESDLDKMFQRS